MNIIIMKNYIKENNKKIDKKKIVNIFIEKITKIEIIEIIIKIK